MESETTKYLSYVLRRLWIIILAAILAGAAGYFAFTQQTRTYQAEVRIFIGNALSTLNPDQNLFLTGERLARTYQQVVLSSGVLEPVINDLNLNMSFEDFRDLISSAVVADTPILRITAQAESPQLAADIANAIANSMISNSPADLTPEQLELMDIQRQQLNALNEQITEAQAQLIDLGQRLINATSETVIESLTLQRNRLQTQITTDQATFTALSAAFSGLADRTNKLEILEPARPPVEAQGVSAVVVGIAGAVVGILLSTAAIVFSAYIDNKVRSESVARTLLKLPMMGTLPKMNDRRINYADPVTLRSKQGAEILETFRTLQANVLYSTGGRDRSKVFVVTSPGRRAGRSYVAAHLAAASAQSGLRVLLIDADLRNPSLHNRFQVSNSSGVMSLLALFNAKPELVEDQAEFQSILDRHILKTKLPTLAVIPSGVTKLSNTQAIGFERLGQIIVTAQEMFAFDLIVIDTTATLNVSDSYVLAAAIKANVLLVLDSGGTTRGDAVRSKEQLEHVGAHISGVILNRAP